MRCGGEPSAACMPPPMSSAARCPAANAGLAVRRLIGLIDRSLGLRLCIKRGEWFRHRAKAAIASPSR